MKIATSIAAVSFSLASLLPRSAECFTLQTSHVNSGTSSPTALHSSTTTTEKDEVNPRKVGLAFQLDDGTRKSHSLAQNTSFVSGFFKGLSNRGAYSNLLTSLYFVYVAMEDAFDATTEDMVKTMDNTELRRVTALREDMEFFYGPGWEDKIQPSKAAKKYVDRVIEVATDNPRLLIAHQYTRYLGDLFGGQMMGGMATRSLNLDGEGVAFYTFDDINSTTDFITMWYKKMNELDLTDKEKEEIVDEANYVFQLNVEILEELDGSPFQAVFTLAYKAFKEKLGLA